MALEVNEKVERREEFFGTMKLFPGKYALWSKAAGTGLTPERQSEVDINCTGWT